MSTLCQDVKLNISAAYLKPGFAFGGSCLPKDLRALVYRAAHLDLKLPLLEAAMPSNEQHLRRAIDAVLDLPAQRIGVIGLAFKEDTDDLRESPVVTLLEQLIGKGREVRVFDPHIRLDGIYRDAIYGSNRNYHSGDHSTHRPAVDGQLGPDSGVGGSSGIGAKTAARATIDRIQESGIPVLDLMNGCCAEPCAISWPRSCAL